MPTWETVSPIFIKVLEAAAIAVIGHFVCVWLARLTKKCLAKTRLDASFSTFLSKSVNYVLHVIVILSALNALGVSTTGLLAAISAAGVAVALALKDSLSNIASGILLLVSPRFHTGDYIGIGSDEGFVQKIDLMHTTIRSYDYRLIVIPNSVILNNPVVNYFAETGRRVEHTIPVPYDCDVEKAKAAIASALEKHPLVLPDDDVHKNLIRVGAYGASSVNISVWAWCKPEDYWTVYFDLLENARAEIKAAGIDVPFDQLDVHMK